MNRRGEKRVSAGRKALTVTFQEIMYNDLKHEIKIVYCANFAYRNKSASTNYQTKIIFQIGRVLVKWIWEFTQHDYWNSISSVFPPKDAESKIQEWTRCSKTMSSVVSFAGIYFYMFTKNLKTRLKRTRRICLSFTKFKQMIFDNAPPRSINRCD